MRDPALITFESVDITFARARAAGGAVTALKDVSFSVEPGRSTGIIGDSGAGKSTLCRVAEGLVRPSAGRVLMNGVDMSRSSAREWREVRRHVSLVFQDALGSFNPMRPVMDGLAMPLIAFDRPARGELRRAVGDVMERVGLRASQMTRYPHEFSGGQIQRLAIARALITQPRLVLLDEPVSALDVSIRAQILNLLMDLASTFDLTYLVISSDPAVARHLTRDMIVLYAGRVIERARTEALFAAPLHPYTVSLLALRDPSLADLGTGLSGSRATRGAANPTAGAGCPFAGICPRELPPCRDIQPDLQPCQSHFVRCHAFAAASPSAPIPAPLQVAP